MKSRIFVLIAAFLLCALWGCEKRFQGSYKAVDLPDGAKLFLDFNSDGTADMTDSLGQHSKGTYKDSGDRIVVDLIVPVYAAADLKTGKMSTPGTTHGIFEVRRQGDALMMQMDGLDKPIRLERR